MSPYRFDKDTAGRLAPSGRVDVEISGNWNVDGRIINGGYLQAVAVRAAQVALGNDRTPIAVSTHYVAPAAPGKAVVDLEVHRTGSRVTAATATMRQGEAVVLTCAVSLTRSQPLAGATGDRPSGTGAEDSLRPPADSMPGPPGLTEFIDYAFVPERSGWLRGDFTGGPSISCWLDFRDGRPVDRLAALAFVDIAPPVCFALGQFGWAPTLQLQTGLFADPSPGPMLLELAGKPYDGAVVAEEGTLWDSEGVLIARSRQIALAPRP